MMIKNILKMVLGLLVGIITGLLIAGVIVVLFNDTTWTEYIDRLISTDIGKILKISGLMMLWMMVSIGLHLILHEVGHLVAGLLTGYRFVSFRIFSYTLIKKNGRFRLRRFAIGGTGGQCLMAPPHKPLSEIDTRWYNAGGVLANLLVVVLAMALCCFLDLPMWADTLMIMLIIVGLIVALMNGIPMKMLGAPNDGYNLKYLEKSKHSKQLLCNILNANASIQEGVEPKELPESYFVETDTIDWADSWQANWQMMVVARMQNLQQWDRAYALLSEALSQKGKMPELFWKEFACEMVFICLVTGRKEEARQLITPDLQKYISDFANTQSSKQRITFAIDLLLENNEAKANERLQTLIERRQEYLSQGEVSMDIAIMTALMNEVK